jgi:hypothetical protein
MYLDRYTNCQFIKYGLYHFNLLQMVLHGFYHVVTLAVILI